ncbi:MAG: hypothetical protein ACFFD2_05325 [Promethearchaeota archaeon]
MAKREKIKNEKDPEKISEMRGNSKENKRKVEVQEKKMDLQSVFPESTQSELRELIPEISFDEIMSCETMEQRAADNTVLLLGNFLGNFDDQFDLNKAMRILHIASEVNVREGTLTLYSIYQAYCQSYGELPWEEFERVIARISRLSSFAPLHKIGENLKFTLLGRIMLRNYQKLKADILAMKKYGKYEEFFNVVEDIRTYWNYSPYGMDIEFVFSITNNLKNLVEVLRAEGDNSLIDMTIDAKLTVIFSLIDQVLEIQSSGDMDRSDISSRQKFRVGSQLISALGELASFLGRKFTVRIKKSREELLETPFPEIERWILENWNEVEWSDYFYVSATCTAPVKFPMILNEHLIKKALKNFLKKKSDIDYEELPKPSPIIDELPLEELPVNEDELIPLKEELFQVAIRKSDVLDYEIVRYKNPVSFSNRLIVFYLLASEGRLHYNREEEAEIIEDEQFHLEWFMARKFEILEKKPNKIEEEETSSEIS